MKQEAYRILIEQEGVNHVMIFKAEDNGYVNDRNFPLKVINNNLYYQGSFAWTISDDIKQVNLNSISEGVQSTYPIRGVTRSQLCKNSGKLYYT